MSTISSRLRAEAWPRRLFALSAALAGVVLGGILLVLVWRTLPFIIETGPGLFTTQWQPGAGKFGMATMVTASLAVSVLALVIAAPLAVFLAAWLRYFAPGALRRPVMTLLELMAGIPSVVYGLWGLLVLVPLINQWAPPGASWLAGSLVLALMILPLAFLVTDAALAQVPGQWLDAGRALSVSRVGLLRRVVLPQTFPAIAGGIVLQFGRALGETMAVLMVCGNVVQWPQSLTDPVRTLTANIALEMAYASGDHRTSLFVSGLMLMAVTGLLLLAAARLRRSHATS